MFRDEASVKTAVLDAVGNVSWVGLVDPDVFPCSVCGATSQRHVLYIVRTWAKQGQGR